MSQARRPARTACSQTPFACKGGAHADSSVVLSLAGHCQRTFTLRTGANIFLIRRKRHSPDQSHGPTFVGGNFGPRGALSARGEHSTLSGHHRCRWTGHFSGSSSGSSYRVQVLAPGFSEQNLPVELQESRQTLTVELAVAAPNTTVVVSADRTPLSVADSGALTSWLDAGQLQTMQPVSAISALRFMPGQ